MRSALCIWCSIRVATRPDGLCDVCGKLKDDMDKPKPPRKPRGKQTSCARQ